MAQKRAIGEEGLNCSSHQTLKEMKFTLRLGGAATTQEASLLHHLDPLQTLWQGLGWRPAHEFALGHVHVQAQIRSNT